MHDFLHGQFIMHSESKLEKVEGQKKANPIGFECPDGPNFPKPG
jgi:hypothetical protein